MAGTGVDPQPIGNAHLAIAPFDTFRCADGDLTVCAANDALFAALGRALGLPGLASDPRFTTNAARHARRGELKDLLEAALGSGSVEHWLGELDLAGVPCGPISSVAQAVGSQQTAVRNMVVDVGGLPVPGNPVKASAWDDPAVRMPAPALDEHGAAVRAEFG